MGADFDWKQMWRPTLQGQIWMLADREVPRAKKKNFLDSSSVISLLLFPSSVKAMYCPSPGSPQHILGWIPFLINAELHSMKSGSCEGIPLTLTAQSSVHCGWDLVVRKSFVWLWANQIVSHAGFILTKSGVLSLWVPKLNSLPSVVIRGRREKTNSRRQCTLDIRWDGAEVFMTLLPLLSLLHTDKIKWIGEYVLPSLQMEKQRVCDLLNSTGLSNCDRCSCS